MKRIMLACILALLAAPAQAFVIKNLGGEPRVLVIEQLGSKQEVTIPAHGRYWRGGVGIILHPEGRQPIITHPLGEYAIWPDGDIHIQRYEKVQIGGN